LISPGKIKRNNLQARSQSNNVKNIHDLAHNNNREIIAPKNSSFELCRQNHNSQNNDAAKTRNENGAANIQTR